MPEGWVVRGVVRGVVRWVGGTRGGEYMFPFYFNPGVASRVSLTERMLGGISLLDSTTPIIIVINIC